MSQFTYDISTYSNHYNEVRVILDPETRNVYTFGAIGAGTPGNVHSGAHIALLTIPTDLTEEALVGFLEGHEESLEVLCSEEIDDGERMEILEGLHSTFHDAQISGFLESRWSASDWIHGDVHAVLAEIKQAGCASIEEAADYEMANADRNNAVIDRDDMVEALRDAIERNAISDLEHEIERMDDDEQRQDLLDALAFWQALLA